MYYVYIISNWNHHVYYTGFTNDIYRRTLEHKEKLLKCFTKKYNCKKLLYFEEFENSDEALHREKQIKRYKREWKESLIRSQNPNFKDLFESFLVS